MEKVNYPKNLLFYVNQDFLTVQKSKQVYYGKQFVYGKVIEAANVPKDIDSYEFAANKVKMYRTEYETATGQFLGLQETVDLIIVRGDDAEIFFNYGYDKEKSKPLYSYH